MSRFFARPGTGTIVSMERFRSGKSLSPIRQAEAYWSALRDGAALPRRSQIDPRGLENLLEYAFILERIAPGIARFRLAGQHLNDLVGMEVRGMPLTTFFTPDARTRMSTVLEHMFDAPAIAELTLNREARPRRAPSEARMILLPLENDLGEVNRALGVMMADGPADSRPARFGATATILRPVTGPQRQPAPAERSPAPGMVEAQQPITGENVPHLRLVT